ncbi:tetratricopeptide repeat protein [Oceanirhabdus sp. W0125-5]|uniref:tetratricopeptide repeat protein n=1 Tax=Oceanirhabdus sp. W0125-5 TaxID=2999116 RepID=UPI0022F2FD64|nr:hypothetical protein [Oceanirhabdus sp. W0125-5]WBW97509.1 hypothetical protein OW730_01310 [Oceanirhabdus sp. W0125-5]
MKKIRIKISTLIIIVTLIIGITVVPTVFKGNILYFIGNVYKYLGKKDVADTYYKKVIDTNKNHKLSVEAAIKRFESLLEEKNLGYMKALTVHQGYGGGGYVISAESLVRINKEYNQLISQSKKDDRVALYEIYVSMMNWFAGETKEALNIIESIDYIKNDELEVYRELNISAMNIVLSEYEKGEELIFSSLRNNKFNEYKQVMLAFIYFMRKEDTSEILEYTPESLLFENDKITGIKKKIAEYEIEKTDEEYVLSVFDEFIDDGRFIRDHKSWKFKDDTITKGNSIVKGKIMCDNKPLRGVIVRLSKHEGLSTGGMFANIWFGDQGYGITDENGEYTIENVGEGDYGVSLTFPWQIITGKVIKKSLDDRIHIKDNEVIEENIKIFEAPRVSKIEYIDDNRIKVEWENIQEVEDVEYIEARLFVKNENNELVGIPNTSWHVELDEKNKNYAIVNMKKTLENMTGRIWHWSSMSKVDPYQLFEGFYIGGDYTFEVNFKYKDQEQYQYHGGGTGGIYSKKENIKIKVQGKKLSEADKYLINKDYEKAIEHFENILQDNPNDLHVLNILSSIYSKGYFITYEDEEKRDGEIIHLGQDLDKALEYTLRLLNVYENEFILNKLERIYSDLDMEEEAFKVNQKLVKEYDKYYRNKYISRYYIRKGNITEAYESIKEFHEKEESVYEDFCDIIMMSIILNDKEELEKLIPLEKYRFSINALEELKYYLTIDTNKYKDFFSNNNKDIDAVKMLEKDNSDLGVLYKGIITLLKRDGEYEEEYTILYNKQRDLKLKRIMKYFGQCEIRSDYGDELY